MKNNGLYKVMFAEYPDIVNVAQIQKMLGVSRHLAYDLITSGQVPGIKIGKAYRIPKVRVIDYVLTNDLTEVSYPLASIGVVTPQHQGEPYNPCQEEANV